MSTRRVIKRRNGVVRKDPPTRAPDGALPWGKLKDPDPTMHYVFVDPGSPFHGVDYYEQRGYTQVLFTEGGVRPVLGGKGDAGSVITNLHQVLMQIPLGDPDDPQEGTKAFLDAPGQAACDRIERKMVQKRGAADGFRGINPDHFAIVNDPDGGLRARGGF